MSTHGPQHDKFPAQSGDQHGGAPYDERFNGFPAAHTNSHGKLFDQFSQRPGVERYGEKWDEFPWKDIPVLHGQHFDEGFDSPSFDADKHGQLHDVFDGSRVRYMYGGQDVEGIVLHTQRDFAVVESREGDRHEVTIDQMLAYATDSGAPSRKEVKEATPGNTDTSVVGGPQGERPSGESATAMGGTHKSLADALEVVKTLAPFDEAVFDADVADFADVAKSFVGVSHLSTKKLSEAHAKFSDHYTAAKLTGNHDRAHFAAQVLASTHAELHTRGVLAEKPDEGEHPTTRGLTAGHAPLRKDAPDDADVTKSVNYHPVDNPHYGATSADLKKHAPAPLAHPKVQRTYAKAVAAHAAYDVAATAHTHRARAYDPDNGSSNAHLTATSKALSAAHAKKNDALNSFHDAVYQHGLNQVHKSVDSDETAVQGDTTNQGANWCKHCQHYCRRVEAGKCPTCGGPVGMKKAEKNWAEALDVLKETTDAP